LIRRAPDSTAGGVVCPPRLRGSRAVAGLALITLTRLRQH